MKKYTPPLGLLLALVLAGLAGACGKKASSGAAAADSAAASAQPAGGSTEAQEMAAALDKKDYDGVVAIIAKAKQAAATKEQDVAVAGLIDDAKVRLIEAAASDPKAADALNAVRQLSSNR